MPAYSQRLNTSPNGPSRNSITGARLGKRQCGPFLGNRMK
ncbi:hypothetical protein BCCR75502_01813 [Burkholderia sola]|nr:hypothetical protein BCCR75389_01798 [Burkholderia cenocepacia]CAG2274579.1 hypothetical protein BCCR75386_01815 [Burkholderia cenocepacia]CAG2274718.1 hypothetical protein BCCR75388_01817 [Burkholderia cenocepacia]CAG2274963.1 hypothetical protein BCCR75384_01815 [Burkholderia cenocepacia]CAG2274988.1 hypothetical protein BCCR75387_01815 [Burkholderia cenocepacia]